MKVYLFPGQGSDERIFSKLNFHPPITVIHIRYHIPRENDSLKDYAYSLISQIDQTKPFILIGVSMGGMFCTELIDMLNPENVIIISSAKCRKELPLRYTFQKHFPLNRIIPKWLIKWGAIILQPLVEPDRNKEKAIFKSMITIKNSLYLKRTSNMIINWDRDTYSNKIIHIHGDIDHTIPIKNVKANYVVKGGSHMMTLTRANEIEKLINDLIN